MEQPTMEGMQQTHDAAAAPASLAATINDVRAADASEVGVGACTSEPDALSVTNETDTRSHTTLTRHAARLTHDGHGPRSHRRVVAYLGARNGS